MPAFTSAPTGVALDRSSIRITWPRPATAQSSYTEFYGARYFQEIGQFNVLQIRGSRGFSRDAVENYYKADGTEAIFNIRDFLDNSQFVKEDLNIQLSRPIIAGFPYFLPQYSELGNFAYLKPSDWGAAGAKLPLIQLLWGRTATERSTYGQTEAYTDTYPGNPATPPDAYYTYNVNRLFSSSEEVNRAPKDIRGGYHAVLDLFSGEVSFFGMIPIPTPQRLFVSQPAHSWKAWGRYTTSVRFIERDNNLIDRAGGRIFVRSISDPNVKSAEDAARVATVFFKKQGAQFRLSGKINRDGLQSGHRLHVVHPAFELDSTDEFIVRNIKTKQIGKDELTEEAYLEHSLTLGTNIGNYQEYSRSVRTATKSSASSVNPDSRSVVTHLLAGDGDVSSEPLPNVTALGNLVDVIVNPQATTAIVSAAILDRGSSMFDLYYRYRKSSDNSWIDGPPQFVGSSETRLTLIGLDSSSDYVVQVSLSPEFHVRISKNFTTLAGRQFNPPYFQEGHVITRSVNEGVSTGTDVGAEIEVTDPTNQSVTFAISGSDAASFDIDSSGQITTDATMDFETKDQYQFIVTITDTNNNDVRAIIFVRLININEDGEIELSTDTPRVGLQVTATLSDPDGRVSPLTVDWEWDRSSSRTGPWTSVSSSSGTIVDSVVPTSVYQGRYIRVTATYTDAFGPNQSAEFITTNTVLSQGSSSAPPEIASDYLFTVQENSAVGLVIGTIVATSPSGSTIAYSLHGGEAASFDIGSSSGQVTVDGDIDYETKADYNFTVRARDVNSRTDEVDIRITVSNVDEPPDSMVAPSTIRENRNLDYLVLHKTNNYRASYYPI